MKQTFDGEDKALESAPHWTPSQALLSHANLAVLISKLGKKDVASFHRYSVEHFEDFWRLMIKQLNIVFDVMPEAICDLSHGVEALSWFPQARLNIANSCFTAAPSDIAIIYEDKNKKLCSFTYGELNQLSSRIANSLVQQGFSADDAIGIAMPMNHYAIAIYLGIIKMGGAVVSIADSFSPEEMTIRLKIANTKAIFTQDVMRWGDKTLPLYQKVAACEHKLKIIVLPCDEKISVPLRENDIGWENFLMKNDQFSVVSCDPMSACNILFSSGTTGIPKAIPWNHTTPIKAASDAFFHQNICPHDVLAWPTNLGWMMGPWLIFAALINHGTIAIYTGSPKERNFGEFIQRAKVTMLGVVPTLVAAWKQSHCMENLDWSAIKVFSSTGECSNPNDMWYLMSLAGNKPVIEYCGGTEIGGAYVSSTVIQNNYPSLFTTPTMGSDFIILDDEGLPASTGEVAVIAPALGLSTTLLNTDHHEVYFANMPHLADGRMLRRHGDQLTQLSDGHYAILGRVDDTMNLGGIKISAAEIERALTGLEDIVEVAAIAIPPPDNGPSLLIIYAATSASLDKKAVMNAMQKKINSHLNPLFKIHDVIFTNELPKTASNKIMRRILRKQCMENMQS